ncbi:multidrug ABC transporter permease [Candidatus Entotheonella serta]|nr:multidrug ABC transporter permease [Candidatus Entotheonella serta]
MASHIQPVVARNQSVSAPAQPLDERPNAAVGVLASPRRWAQRLVSAYRYACRHGLPGIFLSGCYIVLVMLFTAIFATIAVVEDRREGFLQGVLVAPVSRASIVLGQALGSATLAWLQGVIFLILAPLAGIPLSLVSGLGVAMVLSCMAFGLTNMGLMIAWRMQFTQGFHAIMNLILMPIWLLSGAFFPVSGVPFWLEWLMRINPLTYGMAALRRCLYLGQADAAGALPSLLPSLMVLAGFGLATFAMAVITAQRRIS